MSAWAHIRDAAFPAIGGIFGGSTPTIREAIPSDPALSDVAARNARDPRQRRGRSGGGAWSSARWIHHMRWADATNARKTLLIPKQVAVGTIRSAPGIAACRRGAALRPPPALRCRTRSCLHAPPETGAGQSAAASRCSAGHDPERIWCDRALYGCRTSVDFCDSLRALYYRNDSGPLRCCSKMKNLLFRPWFVLPVWRYFSLLSSAPKTRRSYGGRRRYMRSFAFY